MKEAFTKHKFTAANLAMIETINGILDAYEAQGFRLSLRQLYYQLVSKALVENTVRSYKNVGSLVSNARQAGLIDWWMIEDRGRETVSNSHWESPAQIVEAAANSYRIDKWKNQPWHIEVMVEKDALSGVLEPVATELDIAITANKGYSSSSTMYDIGQRLARYYRRIHKICILYLGDHDPSGIDMTRDITDRLDMYTGGKPIEVIRLALNWDQVELWQPPENPARETDARYAAYAAKYGESSWELDAVEPRTLANLVRDEVYEHRDEAIWQQAIEAENEGRNILKKFVDQYNESEGNNE
jgi:hypothetical protein